MGKMDMGPGDTIITNHPAYGGSHLPDVTLVTPVFTNGKELLGYVVNRAHHAELGGTHPASLPPDANSLEEEGVIIEPFRLVSKGQVNWKGLREILESGPWPSRAVEENIADLNAALAANLAGAEGLRELAVKHARDRLRLEKGAPVDFAPGQQHADEACQIIRSGDEPLGRHVPRTNLCNGAATPMTAPVQDAWAAATGLATTAAQRL